MLRRLGLILGICYMFLGMIPLYAGLQEVHYHYNGNFRAKYWQPSPFRNSRPRPAVVYVYDEFVDRVGEPFASKQGYDLNRHILEFSRWDVVTIVPLERHRKLSAIRGAIRFLRKNPMVDPNRIHLVGISEGAVIALAAGKVEGVRSVTMITPLEINDKGIFSYKEIRMLQKKSQFPVFVLSTTRDKSWEMIDNARLAWFNRQNSKFERRLYPEIREWFWNEKNPYMSDIREFIHRNGGINR